jgi:hypothetical protein
MNRFEQDKYGMNLSEGNAEYPSKIQQTIEIKRHRINTTAKIFPSQ